MFLLFFGGFLVLLSLLKHIAVALHISPLFSRLIPYLFVPFSAAGFVPNSLPSYGDDTNHIQCPATHHFCMEPSGKPRETLNKSFTAGVILKIPSGKLLTYSELENHHF
jgi:hypothetical protein